MNQTLRPELTYAVLVGVDTYATPQFTPLHGPALDACRHARWLRSRGVPAANIRLLLSPGDQSREEVAATAAELGLAPRPATQAQIEQVLVDELPEWRGDLLWFAWSGHGILDDRDQQRLFCADARPGYEVNLPMGEFERNLLHDKRYEGIPEKVCVVDACRYFDVPAASLPGTLSFGRTAEADVLGHLQSAYATQDGRPAHGLGSVGGGLFSSHLLAELERSRTWPPDLPAVLGTVRARLSTAAVVQVPYLVERRRDGDRPLPTGSRARLSPHIRTHADEVARLRGKGSYLAQEKLKFVSPGDGSDPKRLLRSLARLTTSASGQDTKRGILLVGPAGAGKTRTCFEVAKAALAQNPPWQVLHVARSSEVSTEDVLAAVREQAGRERVLLVFDYLDSYDGVNLQALGEALQAEDPEGRVACLASVRPGMLGKLRENGVRLLLDEVPLRSDREHTTKVIRQVFADVAPGMVNAWGEDRLSEVCGQRPIIALLIARALEARLTAGAGEPDLVPPRPEELVSWLQARAGQDYGSRQDEGEPARETLLLASAVAAASCEQDQDAVESTVERFLEHWPDPTFRGGPEGVVGRLLHLGWLVESGQGIDAVHDIVTDEFLRMTVLPDGTTVRSDVLKALLSAFLAAGRSFGVASGHLRRWTADLGAAHRTAVERSCANWLGQHTGQLAALVAADPQAGRSAMLALLSGPPWRKGMEDSWERLLGPWLAGIEQHDPRDASTVLATAVRNSVGGVPGQLAAACLGWVDRQWTTRDVGYLLRPLLEADGVGAEDRDQAAERALRWLVQPRSTSRGSALLFAALLRCELGAERTAEVIEFALARMRRAKRNPEAGVVLRPLLLRHGLTEAQKGSAAKSALLWVEAQNQPSGTAMVLDAVLRSENLPADALERGARAALEWLKEYGTHIDASFVLEPLLASRQLGAEDTRFLLDRTFDWLKCHGPARRATYVLGEVLLRDDLGELRAASAIDRAQEWLAVYGLPDSAKFLLSSVLLRTDLDRETGRKLAEDGVDWLARHGLDNGGRYVMAALLRPDAVGGHVDPAAETVLTLLNSHDTPAILRSTLPTVLRCRGVGPDVLRKAAGRALDFLSDAGPEFEATYVLGPLLERRRFLDDHRLAVDLALQWLDCHGTQPEASFVLAPLLGLELTDAEAAETDRLAQAWLADHLPSESACFVLSGLLQRRKPVHDWPVSVETLSRTWLDGHRDSPSAAYVLASLLGGFDAESSEDTADRALSWLRDHPSAQGAPVLVRALTTASGTGPDQYTRWIDQLFALLDARAKSATVLLKSTRFRSDLDLARAARLAEHALRILEGERELSEGLLLGVLRLPLGPERQDRAVRLAFRWLERHSAQQKNVKVVGNLLKRDDLRPDQLMRALDALELITAWRRRAGSEAELAGLVKVLLGNRNLDALHPDGATRRALDWLGSCWTQPEAAGILVLLLDRLDLPPEDGAAVAAGAGTWLAAAGQEGWDTSGVEEALHRYRTRTS
ncbi:hypothetical protein ACFYNO_17570 [Kitasatospora sp. NPDC006697]|uniref:hypothetical protein n=1 Tax=Kitasatospora sp. NPDC006697 TaxID=3364020 RepID=UPI0036CD8BD3